MQYDSEQMTFIGTPGTPAENAALTLHFEIMAAAQTAASSLLVLARKIKQMRDTGGYRALGFDTLEAYTLKTMGMKQRQAYNYIAVAEKLPAQLVEQNAAAGITKLALLAQLSDTEQQQLVERTALAETTVQQLKEEIRELQEKNAGYAEQLSLLQDAAPVAEAQAEEVDMDALRESIRAEVEAGYRDKLEKAGQDRDKALALAEQTCARMEEEAERQKKAVTEARQQGAADAREEAELRARADAEARLAAAETARQQAEQRADALAARMETVRDEALVRFSVLFDQLQDAAAKIAQLTGEVEHRDSEKAAKMRQTLHRALLELAEGVWR